MTDPDLFRRPRAGVIASFVDGARRTLRAPFVVAGTLLCIWLFGVLLRESAGPTPHGQLVVFWIQLPASQMALIADDVGRTIAGDVVNLGSPFPAGINGINGFNGQPMTWALLGPVALYHVLWLFLVGGILDRLARDRPIGTAAFFAATGVQFFRFIRLAVIIGAAYWLVFRFTRGWLFLLLYLFVSVVRDFARVRTVVEDRRSMVGSVFASLRFLRRRAGGVAALYLLNMIALVAAMWLLGWTTGVVATTDAGLRVMAVVDGAVLLWLQLVLMGSEIAFFQGELAHAHYTAAPLPVWPDSPAVEGIENLARK